MFDYGGDAVWHVVVGGDQQGPFAPRQIGELLAEGKIDWEAYVWREGMDGWQPAKDVDAAGDGGHGRVRERRVSRPAGGTASRRCSAARATWAPIRSRAATTAACPA